MARTITYHVIDSEAYDKGYDDGYEVGKLDAFKQMKVDDKGYQMGYNDAVNNACEEVEELLCRCKRLGIHGISQQVVMFRHKLEGKV